MTRCLVIGGGVAGLSAAANLAREMEVTLLEAEDALGYHASGRSAALIEQNYGAPPVQALNKASFPVLQENGFLSPRGLMVIARTEEKEAFHADIETLGLTQISRQDALGHVPVLDPKAVGFAALNTQAYDIDTDQLMQGFARDLRKAGGQTMTRTRVTGIAWRDPVWIVETEHDTYEAETLVNAAGAWADQIAGMAGITPLQIIPHRRSMARIPAPGGADVANWPMFFGVSETWYAKPDAGALLVSPADEDPVAPHDAWAEDETLAEGLARYEAMVTTPVTRLITSWAGLRSFAPDRCLVLGPDPRQPSFVWCAGQGGYGMQTSPAAGQLVADLTLGRDPALPSEIVAALTPGRLL